VTSRFDEDSGGQRSVCMLYSLLRRAAAHVQSKEKARNTPYVTLRYFALRRNSCRSLLKVAKK